MHWFESFYFIIFLSTSVFSGSHRTLWRVWSTWHGGKNKQNQPKKKTAHQVWCLPVDTNACLCICLCGLLQGFRGRVGIEGPEGKPGTQVPILYHISIPSPVNALCVCVSVCPLLPACINLWFFFNNYSDTQISLPILVLVPILCLFRG